MIATLAAAGLALSVALGPVPTVEAVAKPCRDTFALMLHEAGFKGNKNRIAWSVSYRESNHMNLNESSPYFSGALGVFQVQTSAHSGKRWWSREAMLNPAAQSRIVFLHMTNRGRDWSAWGLNSSGTGMDVSQYSNWSEAEQYAYIWQGYETALSLYPDRCAQ